MNKITWLQENKVKLQPACLLQEIYANFLPKKRIIPAGSCGTVAIGGLTLGGGYGFFSRKYGLTCDNLLRVKMIDYKGNTIDSDKDPDLLWGWKWKFWSCDGITFQNLSCATIFQRISYEV
jgi:FAD/FMN-containing dehydrogenase